MYTVAAVQAQTMNLDGGAILASLSHVTPSTNPIEVLGMLQKVQAMFNLEDPTAAQAFIQQGG